MNGTSETQPLISRADKWPLIGLFILALVVYHPLIAGYPVMPDTWERFEPWNTELGWDGPTDERIANANNDAILMYIPWNKFAHDELNARRIPAWDPNCLFGVPLMSNHLVPVFNPVYAIIAWLAPPLLIMGLSGLIHTLIMAIFFYLFLREWLGNRTAAFFAACFLTVSLIPNPHYQPWPMTMAWFPAIWFFYERWLKTRSVWAGAFMALCWGLTLVSAYPSLFVQLSIFTAVWFFVRPMMLPLEKRPTVGSRFLVLMIPLIFGIGISMVQNLPTILASADSDRSIFKSSEEIANEAGFTVPSGQPWQTHVKRLLQPMIPFRFPGNDFFNRGYVGFLPVIFALFSLGFVRRRDYPITVLWMALIVLPFALVPALNFIVYRVTGGVLIDPNPPVEVFGFLVLMLAGEGLHRIKDFTWDVKNPSMESIIAFWLMILTIIFVLSTKWIINPESVIGDDHQLLYFTTLLFGSSLVLSNKPIRNITHAYLLMLIIFCGLTTADYFGPEQGDEDRAMPESASIVALEDLVDPNAGGEWGRIVRYSGNDVNVMSLTDQPYTFYPNLGTYFGIPDAFGYHNLAPRSRFDFLRSIEPDAVIERRGIVAFRSLESIDNPILGAMGVRYILSDVRIEGREPVLEIPGIYVYEYAGRNQSIGRVAVIDPDGVEWVDDVHGVVLDAVRPDWAYEPAWVVNEPGRVVVGISCERPVGVIFNEGYSPGWTVNNRGEKLDLKFVNGIGMYVEVNEGRHVLEFRYEMPGLKAGWVITILSLVVCFLGAFIFRKYRIEEPQA